MFLMVVTSHSGMLLTRLLLLGCSPLTLTDPPTCGLFGFRCGNLCVWDHGRCDCGGTTLRFLSPYIPRYHCCTNTSCTKSGDNVLCPGGQVQNITEPCGDGRCYGYSKWDSWGLDDRNLGMDYFKSQYSCSGDLKDCLPIKHRCQGLSSCGDSQVCNEELICTGVYGRVEIKRLNTSQVQHSFCQYFNDEGDRSYQRINRSDENITNIINVKESPMIDYSYLKPCGVSDAMDAIHDARTSFYAAAKCRVF